MFERDMVFLRWSLVMVSVLALSGCSARLLVVNQLANELAGQNQGAENDPELARDAAPFYLKLSEAVLAQTPGHAALSEGLAARMTEYAYAFVALEADFVEAQDSEAAHKLRHRAAHLYARARNHAMGALERRYPGLQQALAIPESKIRLQSDDVGLAYWAAASWGSWISLSKDNPDIVADLPLVVRLAALASTSEPGWGNGALISLRATLEAARPGGDSAQAARWFDQAIDMAQGRNAAVFVAKAESVALPKSDRAEFERLLQQALAVVDEVGSPLTLQNQIMRRRAAWLLQQSPDLF